MLPEKRMFGQHLGNIIFRFLLLHGTRLSAQINTCHLHTKRLENLFFKPLLYFYPFPAIVRYRALLARILPITYQRKDSPAHSFRARRALCGAAWQRSSVLFRLQAAFRAPPKTFVPIVYLPFGGIAPSSLRLFLLPPPCNRGSGILTTGLLLWLPLCSATPCGSRHLLLSGAGQ